MAPWEIDDYISSFGPCVKAHILIVRSLMYTSTNNHWRGRQGTLIKCIMYEYFLYRCGLEYRDKNGRFFICWDRMEL